jgi:hypothetical protein
MVLVTNQENYTHQYKNKKIMKKFIISESEKQRILEMHQNATSRQYLMEGADPRITTLFNNIVTQVNSKIAEINKSKGSKIPNVSFKEVAADDPTLVNYNFYMGQNDLGQVPQKYLVINQSWSSFETKIYNLFKYSTNPSFSYQPGKLYTPTQN